MIIRLFDSTDVPALALAILDMAPLESHDADLLGIKMGIAIDTARMDLVVAIDGTKLIGFATFTTVPPTEASTSFTYIEQLYVLAGERRRGAGRRLLAWIARETRDRGGRRVEWSTTEVNVAARALYRGLGAVGTETMQYVLAGEAFERLVAQEQEVAF